MAAYQRFIPRYPQILKKKTQMSLKLEEAIAFQGFKLLEKLAAVNTVRRHKGHRRGLQ